ncbi:Integrator complex subunit 7 [Podila humilis]|nr:Integrator complex subunit 7 [Podila humilis]
MVALLNMRQGLASTRSGAMSDEGFQRLMEIETKYRTHRSADQLHAIASFSRLFDDFPGSVIINAGILKLADYYRNSNNIQRHAILQVVKKSESHLKKVLNVEETIKRISPTLHSNDPLARALTLRVFGCMATIVSDRTDVYHIVIHSLDSSEAMEVSAAIFAADRICAQSQKFCAIISGKLAFMVRDSKTPLPLRRRLIRIFGHMFEDITLARLARKTCLDILDMNQDSEYTVAILRTLTRLASHSLVDVQQQIELLLQGTQTYPSSDIQRVALTCIALLAQKGIEFHPQQIHTIFEVALQSSNEKTILRCMVTLGKIFRLPSSWLSQIMLKEDDLDIVGGFLQMTIKILKGTQSRLVKLECFSLLSLIFPAYKDFSRASFDDQYVQSVSFVTKSMELFLVWIWSSMTASRSFSSKTMDDTKEAEARHAKAVLEYWLSLTLQQSSTLEGQQAVDAIFTTLLDWIDTYRVSALEKQACFQETESFILMFRALLESAAITRTSLAQSDDAVLEARLSPLFERFAQRATSAPDGSSGSVDIPNSPCSSSTYNRWELYQLARFSLQSGWPALALLALKCIEPTSMTTEQHSNASLSCLQNVVQSVPHGLWLATVQSMAEIESSVQRTGQQLVKALQAAHAGSDFAQATTAPLDLYEPQQRYAKVIGHLEEMGVYKIDRTFHIELCSLRRNYLRLCQLAFTTLHLLSSTVTRCRQTHQDQRRYFLDLPGDETELLKCAEQLNELAHRFTLLQATLLSTSSVSLSSTIVDSSSRDLSSNNAMETLYTLCLILAYALQKVASILSKARSKSKINNPKSPQIAGDAEDDGENDTFDIDPLLIPLLFGQGLDSQETTMELDMEDADHGKRIAATLPSRRKTSIKVFRQATQQMLAYLVTHVRGRDLPSLECGISITRQLIAQFVAYPVPVPQEFFVSKNNMSSTFAPSMSK